jgi:hypothetical protein
MPRQRAFPSVRSYKTVLTAAAPRVSLFFSSSSSQCTGFVSYHTLFTTIKEFSLTCFTDVQQ